MCERLNEQRTAIQLYLKRHNKRNIRDLDLNEDEWDLIVNLIALLAPVEEISKILCEDSSPISMQFPLAHMVHSALSNINVPEELISVRDKMLDVLAKKFFHLIDQK